MTPSYTPDAVPWLSAVSVASSDAEEFDRLTPDPGIVRGYRAPAAAILDESGKIERDDAARGRVGFAADVRA